MSEEIITIEEFLDKLTQGDYKTYFNEVCDDQNKDIQNTKELIYALFIEQATLDLETILDLKNFLKAVLRKDHTRKLLSKNLQLLNGSYNIHDLFFIKRVYLFLHALNREHPLLKEPLNYINFYIHSSNTFFEKENVEIKLENDKHVYYFSDSVHPYADERLSSIINSILYYTGKDKNMNKAKEYMENYMQFFKTAARRPIRQGGKKKSKKTRKKRKSKKRKSKKSRKKRR